MKLDLKNIFLFDGIGAFFSFIFTGLILPNFSQQLGTPKSLLHFLAIFPFVYFLYSLATYCFSKEIKSWQLKTIMIANLVYCSISALLILNVTDLLFWGRILLATEIIIVAGVVFIEYQVFKRFYG